MNQERIFQILKTPHISEKSSVLGDTANQAVFQVSNNAKKAEIKEAVEQLFDVKVAKVRTQSRKGKLRRYRFRFGRTSDWKKAIVQLHEDHRIDFF